MRAAWPATAALACAALVLPFLATPAARAGAAPAAASGAIDDAPLRLSLDDAVARALSEGDDMRFPRALIREAHGRIHFALAEALPQINGVYSYSRSLASVFDVPADDSSIGSLLANSPFAAKNTWELDITARQLLWSGGKVGAGLRAAVAVRRAADSNQRETAMDVTYRTRKAYLDAALAQRVVAIAESSLAQSRAHLAQVRLYRREGARSEYELLRAEVDAANQEPPVVEARNNSTLAQLELKRVAHVPLEQELVLTTPLVADDETVPVPVDTLFLRDARPALQQIEAEVVARRMALRVEQGRRWPDLYFTSTLSHSAFTSTAAWPERDRYRRSWNAGARLEFPIFVGLRTEGGIDIARADLERALAQRDQTRVGVELEIEQARTGLERTGALLAARRETVRQAQRAFELASVRFSNGLSPQIEVSDARLQHQNAELNEVQATRDYLLALASLEKAVGHTLPVERRPVDSIGMNVDPEKEGR